jgi:hypothetical protein
MFNEVARRELNKRTSRRRYLKPSASPFDPMYPVVPVRCFATLIHGVTEKERKIGHKRDNALRCNPSIEHVTTSRFDCINVRQQQEQLPIRK